jgi:hypothetical protein
MSAMARASMVTRLARGLATRVCKSCSVMPFFPIAMTINSSPVATASYSRDSAGAAQGLPRNEHHGGRRLQRGLGEGEELLCCMVGRACRLGDHDDVVRARKRRNGLRRGAANHFESMPRRKVLRRLGEHPLRVARCELQLARQPVELDRLPASSKRPQLARERDAPELAQPGVLEEQAEQIEIENAGELDTELHCASRGARLQAEDKALERMRRLRRH